MKDSVRRTLTPEWDKAGIVCPLARQKSIINLQGCPQRDHPGRTALEKPIENFITGSSYQGSWDSLGFAGFGKYTFPHGATYEGYFNDGQFHGKGIMTYPTGHKLRGIWRHGRLMHKKFVFHDGLEVTHPWNYCQFPDRRFQVELNTSFQGPGEEILTNRQPTVEIPDGCYDTIDGFYVPEVKCIFRYDEEGLKSGDPARHGQRIDTLKRTVLPEESEFIEKNFRKSHLGVMGYSPDLYEFWTVGRGKEVKEIMKVTEDKSELFDSSEEIASKKSSPVMSTIESSDIFSEATSETRDSTLPDENCDVITHTQNFTTEMNLESSTIEVA